jgi:hypothetical protein
MVTSVVLYAVQASGLVTVDMHVRGRLCYIAVACMGYNWRSKQA